MTSSNTLKKLVSISAALLLAVGSSLTSAAPASAVGGDTITWTSSDPNAVFSASSSSTYVQTGVTSGSTVTAPTVTNAGCTFDRWADWRNGSNFSYRTFPYVNYYEIADREYRALWVCPPILTTAPTAVISGSSAVATPGVWARGTVEGRWLICGLSVSAGSNMNGYFNGNAAGCESLYTSNMGMSFATATTLDLTATYYKPGNQVASLPGSKLVWVESASVGVNADGYANTAHLSVSPSNIVPQSPPGSSSARPLSAEQARNVLKPVPAAVQPLVPAFIALNKPMASLGGKVALSSGDFTGLVSAKIAGKSLDFILGNTGKITMTVPQGEAGKTADLVLTFNTGSIILQDAIKYVAPVVVAEVPARPISISSSSKSISEEAKSEIRQAAFANVKNTAVACVGYASANDASARSAALALATKACAIANKANSDLAITGINVVVDKLKARTQGVGIKVYKADN